MTGGRVTLTRNSPHPLLPSMAPARHRDRTHQAAFRSSVINQLGAGFGNRATWSLSGGMPFLTNLADLADAPPFDGVDTSAILLNHSAPTALEQSNGLWAPAMLHLAKEPPRSILGLAAAFDQHVWPSRSQPGTRSKHWDNWAVVVTWAIAWGALLLILPMPTYLLKAITWELLCMGTPRSVITAIWAAIQNRHRIAGLHPPIYGFGEFSAWTRCLSSLLGRPSALRFPIHRSLVVLLLRLRPASLRDNRDRLMVALATICCLRVSELVALQVCDLWFDFHTGYGIPGFHGTAAVHVGRRKNDVERKGHHPALGRASDPTLDLVHQLLAWLALNHLAVSPLCTKQAFSAARCPHCPPLFSRLDNGPAGTHKASLRPLSTQMVGDSLRRMMAICGANVRHFSGISARKGGLSTAITAGVTEEILFLQSGHGQARAARNYIHLQDPARLFDTFRA